MEPVTGSVTVGTAGTLGSTGTPGLTGTVGVPEVKSTLVERSHLDDVIKDRDAAKAKVREYEAKVTKYETEQLERSAKEAKIVEESKLLEAEESQKYQEAKRILDEQHTAKYKKLQENVNKKYVPASILAAASKIPGLTQDAIELLPTLLERQVRVDPETLEPQVIDSEGRVVKSIGTDGVPMTIEELVTNFTKGKKTFFTDSLPVGTGATNQSSSGKAFTFENALADSRFEAEWIKKDPEGYEREKRAYAKGAVERAKSKFSTSTTHSINRVTRK